MLVLRSKEINATSWLAFQLAPMPELLATFKTLIPEAVIIGVAKPFYSEDMGRGSEDPVLLTKVIFLSFLFNIKGDETIIDTLAQRLDWLQFCDLSIGDKLFDRTTLVKFRRTLGPLVITALFANLLDRLRQVKLVLDEHRFFDGSPVKACARINMYRDEIYTDPLAVIERRLRQLSVQQLSLDFDQNPSPVVLEKDAYAIDNSLVEARRTQEMKPVAERQSKGDPDARFQRAKHGKPGELGYETFFSTDAHQLFITDVDVSAETSQGQTLFKEKLEQSLPGQTWSVDGEFTTGPLLATAEDQQVTLNTPPRPLTNKGFFPKTEFSYDAATNTYSCPGDQTLSQISQNKETGDRTYRPAAGTCATCPLKSRCTTSKTERSINRSTFEEALNRNRGRAVEQEAVMGRVLRGVVAEGKFAEAVRHGLKIMRYVGLNMAKMQATLIALILNMKRYLRIITDLEPNQRLA
jgi:transposase